MRTFLAGLVLSAFAFGADSEWQYVASQNFELYTSAGDRDARKTLEYFEVVRDFFMRAASSGTNTPLPVTIIVFKNRSQFKPFAPTESASAFYVGDQDRDYMVLSGVGMDHYPAAVHEYVHLLVRHSGLHPPTWLNEGLAEVYSTLQPVGGKVVVGTVPKGRAYALRAYKWLPARTILAVGHDSPEYNEKDRAGIFYAQSWLLTHMLMLDERYAPKFSDFLQEIAKKTSAPDALRKIWNLSVPDLDAQLAAYSRSNRLRGAIFDLKLAKFEGFEPSPADPLAVDIQLAILAGLNGRKDDAVAQLQALAEKHPDRSQVHEALGFILWREHDLEGARRHYRRATELNSPHWKTWWDFARLMRGIDHDESTIRALRRVIELNGTFTEARVLLGEEYNHVRRYQDALTTLHTVKKVEPTLAARYFLAAAFAYSYLDREEPARNSAQRAKEVATSESERDRADELLRHLELRRRAALTPPAPIVEEIASLPASAPAGAPALAPPKEQLASISGVFKELDCMGDQARVRVVAAGKTTTLLIRDPSRINIKGRNESMTLTCGPQPPGRQITVDYIPKEDRAAGSAGDVRRIAFN